MHLLWAVLMPGKTRVVDLEHHVPLGVMEEAVVMLVAVLPM